MTSWANASPSSTRCRPARTSRSSARASKSSRRQLGKLGPEVVDAVSNTLLDHLVKTEEKQQSGARWRRGRDQALERLAAVEHNIEAHLQRSDEMAKAHDHALSEIYEALVKLSGNPADARRQPEYVAGGEQRRHQHHQQPPAGDGAHRAGCAGASRRTGAVAAPDHRQQQICRAAARSGGRLQALALWHDQRALGRVAR